MRMPPLEIDFSARRRLASPLGWLLLAAGAVAMVLVSLDHLAALDALRLVEVEQARAHHQDDEGQREQDMGKRRDGKARLGTDHCHGQAAQKDAQACRLNCQ